MTQPYRPFAFLALAAALAGCPSDPAPNDTGPGSDVPDGVDAGTDAPVAACSVTGYPTLDATRFINGLEAPVYVTQAPGSDDFFIVEQAGRIRVAGPDGTLVAAPFLDITSLVEWSGTLGDEQGLLGLAFHPDYETNGLFYVYYTQSGAGTGVGEDQVVAVGTRATARTASPTVDVILAMADQAGNHNGGCLQFGPDGELYIATGDGGPQGDPEGDAQDTTNPLGKILRIHVDATTGTSYTIPAGNPFTGGGEAIYHYGLRNPWRFSFDRATGDLYVGDVGQNAWEEVSVVEAGTAPGVNFGWNPCEGFNGYTSGRGARCTFDHHFPAVAIAHTGDPVIPGENLSVIGGYVYRGSAMPGLVGAYLFADAFSGSIGAFRYCDGEATEYQELADLSGLCNGPVSFGEGNDGELYLVCISGSILRIGPG